MCWPSLLSLQTLGSLDRTQSPDLDWKVHLCSSAAWWGPGALPVHVTPNLEPITQLVRQLCWVCAQDPTRATLTPWQNSVAKLKEIQPFVHSMLFLVTWIGITPFLRSKLLPSNWRHCYQLLKSDWSKSTKLGKQQKKKQKQKYTNRPKIKLALHRSCLKSHIRHITNGSLCVQVLAKTTNRKGRCSMSQSPPPPVHHRIILQ